MIFRKRSVAVREDKNNIRMGSCSVTETVSLGGMLVSVVHEPL